MKAYIFSLWMLFLSISTYAENHVTLYTKCGKAVTGVILPEISDAEKNALNTFTISTYPNATFLAGSTRSYNCHSYAWNMTQGGQTCWVDATINTSNDNLSKYWTGDYYTSTTPQLAQKIFYIQSDHSAVVSSVSGMYESKWGKGPLMRHAPGYGPYNNMNTRKYYRHVNINGLLNCSSGTGETYVGISSDYSPATSEILPYGSFVQTAWTVEDAKGDNAIGTKANVSISGANATISFNTPGLYDLTYSIHLSTGELLATYWFMAVVEQ
ncbi:hypothetical protein C3V43_10510 [Bacteroides heparinolyticus]|uniref:hypothetical protein n=1 Tax=Prevotella heparinolytica TaxID=28113 RepID=UPI000D02DE05|nr:hypothetical protein [Bacteroides heparinolyticus]AVM58135.1 hypothetical protein C3V43_10510 [Bacteroides heparinolyticus]